MASVVTPTVTAGFNLAAPGSAPTTVFSGTGGLLGNGNYQYKVTFLTLFGESLPSSASIAGNPGTATGSAAVSAIATGNAYVTGRRLYRTVAGGASFLLLTTINDNVTTTFSDTIADASLGAAAPTANTANPTQTVNTIPTYTGGIILQPGGSGNTVTLNSVTPAASRVYTLPDSGVASNVMLSGIKGATPSVTQLTSNTTAVTTTATCGIITMFGTIANGATGAFTLNNTNILATSNVLAWSNMLSATGVVPVSVVTSAVAAGSVTITVTNNDGANATKAAAAVYYLII